MNQHAVLVIDALGGTAEVARLCEVRMPSVSKWRHDGVPHARLKYLAEVGKDKLQGIDLRAACSNKRGPGAVRGVVGVTAEVANA